MNGENLAFISHTRRYLEHKAIVCYGATKGTAQKDDINRINGNTFGSDAGICADRRVRPGKGAWRIRGPEDTGRCRHLWRNNANWPANRRQLHSVSRPEGRQSAQHPLRPGQSEQRHLQLRVHVQLHRLQLRGDAGEWRRLCYHQTTADCWTASVAQRYPGATIIHQKVGPAYDDTHVGGFGCLARDKAVANRWHIYAQSPNGIKIGRTG